MGGRKPTVSDSDILSIFYDADDPVLSSTEVSEELSIGKTGTYQRLRELQEKGYLNSKKIGRGRAWWLADSGTSYVEKSEDEK